MTYLIISVSGLMGSKDANGKSLQRLTVDDDSLRLIKIFADNDSKETSEASINSLISEDGKLAGPDVGNKLNKVNSRYDAEKDIVSALLGVSVDELRASLDLEIAKNKAGNAKSRAYILHKTILLDYLLQLWNAKGAGEVHNLIQKHADIKRFPGADEVRRDK